VLLIVTDQERGWDLLPAGFIDRHCPARSQPMAQRVSFTNVHTPSPFRSMARSTRKRSRRHYCEQQLSGKTTCSQSDGHEQSVRLLREFHES
jgi:hypothetical protein